MLPLFDDEVAFSKLSLGNRIFPSLDRKLKKKMKMENCSLPKADIVEIGWCIK